MSAQELSDSLDEMIIAAITSYEKSIIRVQNQIYDAFVLKLKELELDSQGYIKQNSVNRRILREIYDEFDNVVSKSQYQPALESYLRVIPKINKLSTLYFQSVNSDFTPNKNFLKSLQAQTIKTVNDLILQDGLRAQVKIPLNQILEQNISSGGSYSGMLEQVKNFVKGGENEGRLLKYARTYTTDALFNYSRAFMEAVTADLKLDWYVFSGGIIDKTRSFCEQRTGKFFHRKEIESWADLTWKGRDPLTTKSSIFILLGGFNCRHSLIPVSESIVPQDDISRIN